MGIYIKGMEMPKDCGECPLVEKCKNRHLEITESDNGYEPIFIQDDCPLTEISEPHGRLIDIDKALEVIALEYGYDGIEDDMEYKVPTVIESEAEK